MNPETNLELGRAGVGTPLEARPTVQPARLLLIRPNPNEWSDWVAWLNRNPTVALCGLRKGTLLLGADEGRRIVLLRRDGVLAAIAHYRACGGHLQGLLSILKEHWRHPRKVYPKSFNAELRERIRRRDGCLCQVCGTPQSKHGKELAVHHIDYNRENSDPLNLVALCHTCHTRTNKNRTYWTALFQWRAALEGGERYERVDLAAMGPRVIRGLNMATRTQQRVGHTPGPWEARDDAAVCLPGWRSRLDGGCIIQGGLIRGRNGGGRDEIMANARLIASAPDLLAAIVEMVAEAECPNDNCEINIVRIGMAAIAKAQA